MLFFAFILISFTQSAAILRPENELSSHCYNFPAKDFGKSNNVRSVYGASPKLILNIGDMAIDFTLPTPSGDLVNLNNLLTEKPVVMIWGHYTCPAWQGLHSDTMFIGSSFEEEYEFVEAVKDKVHVLHLVGPEPHPMWPSVNFDSGSIKMNLWSTIRWQIFTNGFEESYFVPPAKFQSTPDLQGKTWTFSHSSGTSTSWRSMLMRHLSMVTNFDFWHRRSFWWIIWMARVASTTTQFGAVMRMQPGFASQPFDC